MLAALRPTRRHAVLLLLALAGWLALRPDASRAADAAEPGAADIAAAVAVARALPAATDAPALAAHATGVGHWVFANTAGDTYTAGTPAELERAPAIVGGVTSGGFGSIRLVLTRSSLFAPAEALKALPKSKATFVALAGDAYPVRTADPARLEIALKPGVILPVTDKATFDEAIAQLLRTLDGARLRTLALVPGGRPTLSSRPRTNATGAALIDPVDPDRLASALAAIPGQMAILTAKVSGSTLTIAPEKGPDVAIPATAVMAAAAAAGVDLVVLEADPPRQPGGLNWLWQKIEVAGLDHATRRGTFADFLDQLAAGRAPLSVSVSREVEGRTRLSARFLPHALSTTEGVAGWLKDAAGTVAGTVTGAVDPTAVHASLVSADRRNDPWRSAIAATPPAALVGAGTLVLAAIAGFSTACRWWLRLWPLENRADYPSMIGYILARTVRMLAFFALFLPLAALPACASTLFAQLAHGPRRKLDE